MLTLPVELVVDVLEQADPKTLRACKATSLFLRDLIRTTSSLASVSLLSSNALACTGHNPYTDSRTLLYRIHSYLASWRSLNFKSFFGIHAAPGWQMHGGRVLSRRLANSAAFFRMPSPSKSVSASAWVIDDISSHALVSVDVGQDLLVAVQRNDDGWFARSMTLSTGACYPNSIHKSWMPLSSTSLAQGDTANIRDLQVYSSTIGLLCGSKPKTMRLVLFNIQTGCLIADLSILGLKSFAFIAATRILVATSESPNGARSSTYRQVPTLYVYDVEQPDTPRTRFEFPVFPNSGFIAGLSLSTDATTPPSGPDSTAPSADVRTNEPFTPARDPYDRIFSLWLQHEPDVVQAPNTWSTQSIVLSARAFAPHLAVPGATIPWAEWGPQHSRLIQHDERIGLVDGRTARLCDGQVEVRDFAPARVHRAITQRCARAKGGASAEVVREPTVWPYSGGAETKMPYILTQMGVDDRVEAVHAAEDGLVYDMRRAVDDLGVFDAEGIWAEGDRQLVIHTS